MKELSLDCVMELIAKSGKIAGLEYIVHEFMDAYNIQATDSGKKKFSEWMIGFEKESNKILDGSSDEEIAGMLIMNSVIDPNGFFAKLRKSIIVMGMKELPGFTEKDIESVLSELPY
jgi:hypothetical protein